MVHRRANELSAYHALAEAGAYYELRYPCLYDDGSIRTYAILAPQPLMPWHNTTMHGALTGALVSVLKALKEGA